MLIVAEPLVFFFLTVSFLKNSSHPPSPIIQTMEIFRFYILSYSIICSTMNAPEGEVQGKIMERREKEEVVGNNTVDYFCICVLFLFSTKQAEVLTLC